MGGVLGELGVGLAIGVALSALLYGAVRIRIPGPLLVVLAIAPVVFIYLANPPARVCSNHGFMHASLAYQMMQGNVPPPNPLLHGEPLAYPWLYHLVAAGLALGLGLSPFNAFALINLCCLALTALVIFKLARMIFEDRATAIMAVALAIFGMTVLCQGPLAGIVQGLVQPVPVIVRGMPPLAKFANVNPNPLGILFFALFLYGAVAVFARRRPVLLYWGALILSVIGTGLLYPFLLPALWASCVAVAAVALLRERRAALLRAGALVVCVAVATLLVLPYVLGIGSARGQSSQLQIVLSLGRTLTQGGTLLLTTGIVIVLLILKRRALWGQSPARRTAVLMLIASAAATGLMNVFCAAPLGTEYKFLMLTCLLLGVLAAPCLWDLYRRRPLVALPLHAGLLLPLASFLLTAATADWQLTDPYHEKGRYLRHADEDQDALYSWIMQNTAADAVFVDSQPTIPVFALRQLYVSMDLRQPSFGPGQPRDGWGMPPYLVLTQSHGYDAGLIEKRMQIVAVLCSGRVSRVGPRVFSELVRTTGEADVYVVARYPGPIEFLAKDHRFHEEFGNAAAVVYRVLK